ncbi:MULTISPECIES: DUF2019 domain-containing protein [Prevotellaceae]|uniref:DUF2019 domain-containing protein n=1 Tax=Prevotellaceae TaxID=171552 RepID=UPI0005101921|nr:MULTISPECIES: DUF2019 domain-containing protein [Prevotellaceae]KGF42597.1 hypothetical protein HMPREF2140_01065 [Hoylesella buccalis DNF00985]
MESLKKIEAACRRFEEAAIKHAEATETGNYAQTNKSYQVIAKSARYLKETNSLKHLSKLLDSESVGVRMWAATYLLPIFERNAMQILQSIASGNNIHSLTAKMTIDEWEKGTLIL